MTWNELLLVWPEQTLSTAFSSMLLNAANKKVAYIAQAPLAGTIDRVCFRTGVVTTPETCDIRLETLGAGGDPSGTLWAPNTNVAVNVNATSTWFEAVLTTGAVVAKGDFFAVVIALPGTTSANFNITRGNVGGFCLPPTVTTYDGVSAWTRQTSAPVGAVRYSDGTYARIPGLYPFDTLTQTTNAFNSGSTPDERGNKFTIPFRCKVLGMAWRVAATASLGDWTGKLYDANDTLLASKAVDGDLTNQSGPTTSNVLFDNEVVLAAGQVVRLTRLPTSATNTAFTEFTVPSTALGLAAPGRGRAVHTQRTDAGAWTDTPNKVSMVSLLVSAIDNGARSYASLG